MKLMDAIKLAFKNLLRTRFRSFLTILGVIIGISAIVLFMSLGVGLQKITSDQIASIDALTTLTVNQKPETAAMEAGQPLTLDTINTFKSLSGVDKVSPSVSITGNASVGGTSTGAIIFGVKPENSSMEISNLKSGELFQNSGQETIISTSLANALDANPDSLVGKDLTVQIIQSTDGVDTNAGQFELKIIGIDTNETANIAYVPFDKVWEVGKFDKLSGVKVKVKSRQDIENVRKSIENKGFAVTTIKDLIDQIDKIFFVVEAILVFVGGIGLLVASLGIINTMTISLLERTHEIGIMKAIGATNRDIRKLFFWESALIGILGGILGVVIALLFDAGFNFVINLLIKSKGQHLDFFVVPINFSFIIIIFAVLISIFSGLYPTIRAQKLSPIDALRQ